MKGLTYLGDLLERWLYFCRCYSYIIYFIVGLPADIVRALLLLLLLLYIYIYMILF